MARTVAALLLLVLACAAAWIAPGIDWIARDAMAFSKTGEIHYDQLPPEAKQTLALIRKGGPYPHERDGSVFGNREGLLPKKPRGYYREFTVRTPRSRDRGARRIVGGRGAGAAQGFGEFYYTDDHYRSFRRILE